jgi:sugar lactone lactonase YvrE
MLRDARCVQLYLALATMAIAGCNAASRSSPPLTGTMVVTVTPADGIKPSVSITGPNLYSKTVTRSQTLTNLAIGDYYVTADSVVHPDTVVGNHYDTVGVTGSPASVQTGDTVKVAVTYALERQTGGMWVANNADSVLPEYSAPQLHATGTPAPAEALVARAASGPAGLALDPNGNLWESDFNSDTLFMYSAAARNTDSTVPSAKMWSSVIGAANNITFDAQGDLWVADGNGFVFEYSPSQLTTGGSQYPALQISGAELSSAYTLAFDASGNLWVGDNGNSHILEYTAAQLTGTGPSCTPPPAQCTPTPADTIGTNNNSINGPSGLAFDSQGNLWVANVSGGTIVEYTPAQATSNGAPVPQVTITAPVGAEPAGLAFDNSGSLWVGDEIPTHSGAIYSFTKSQLAATGSPTPAVTITGQLAQFYPAQIVFDPGATIVAPTVARVRGARPRASHAKPAGSHTGRMNPSLARALRRR